jgi:hypothetical protein
MFDETVRHVLNRGRAMLTNPNADRTQRQYIEGIVE